MKQLMIVGAAIVVLGYAAAWLMARTGSDRARPELSDTAAAVDTTESVTEDTLRTSATY
jgi:hypothetical protein